jgi:hypothetical protein
MATAQACRRHAELLRSGQSDLFSAEVDTVLREVA